MCCTFLAVLRVAELLARHICHPRHLPNASLPILPPPHPAAGYADFWCSRACARRGDAEYVDCFFNSPRSGVCGYRGPLEPGEGEEEDLWGSSAEEGESSDSGSDSGSEDGWSSGSEESSGEEEEEENQLRWRPQARGSVCGKAAAKPAAAKKAAGKAAAAKPAAGKKAATKPAAAGKKAGGKVAASKKAAAKPAAAGKQAAAKPAAVKAKTAGVKRQAAAAAGILSKRAK